MDEPFAALDYQTRLYMQRFLSDIWREFRKTIVFVTHQIEEALALSDRVFLMSACPGRISEVVTVQLSRPRDISCMEFNQYRARVLAHLEREVSGTFGERPE
jgi:ABC-type nitrate/sulfonate/bicarbonate transport system ATPase subunit